MRTVAFVPIKLNSKRLPQKNILSLSDHQPLISCILETLSQCNGIDDIYVFCSEPNISHYLPTGVHLILRSPKLDSDRTTSNDLVKAFAEAVSADFYIMAHATSPLLTAKSLEKGIQAVHSGKYDSAFSVVKVCDFLWENDVPLNYDVSCVPRTQELPLIYKETCGFYVYTKQLALDYHRRIGFNPKKIEVSTIEALDIDEQQDFWIADAIRQYCKERGLYYAY